MVNGMYNQKENDKLLDGGRGDGRSEMIQPFLL